MYLHRSFLGYLYTYKGTWERYPPRTPRVSWGPATPAPSEYMRCPRGEWQWRPWPFPRACRATGQGQRADVRASGAPTRGAPMHTAGTTTTDLWGTAVRPPLRRTGWRAHVRSLARLCGCSPLQPPSNGAGEVNGV